MQATVYFRLSTEGQRDALRRGLPAQAEQTINGEIGADDLQFFDISPAGDLAVATYWRNNFPRVQSGYVHDFNTVPTSIDEALAPFRARAKREAEIKAAEKAKRQAEIEAWRAKPVEELFTPDPYRPGMLEAQTLHITSSLYPDLAAKYGKLIEERNELLITMRNEHNEKVSAENRAKEQAKKDAEAAKEQAKKDYIADWVRRHTDEETQAQFAENLLDRKALIADIARAELSFLPADFTYTICDDEVCKCYDRETSTLNRSQYAAWRKIKATLPEGSTHRFFIVAPCLKADDDEGYRVEPGPVIAVAHLSVPVGPFLFTRTVSLGS